MSEGIERISITANGQTVETTPENLKHALRVVKAGAARKRAAKGDNTDLEEFTGNEGQEEREAEVGGIAVDRLRSIIERIERLEEEKKALANDVKDIFGEAKSAGFDSKVIRELLKIRKMEGDEADRIEAELDLYKRALGM